MQSLRKVRPPRRKRKKNKTAEDFEEEEKEDKEEEELEKYGADNPNVSGPIDRNAARGILPHKKLEAGDHVLITCGPAPFVEDPEAWHGGRLNSDRYGLDARSTCTKGAFVKPWLRVPKGGCLGRSRRESTDKQALRLLWLMWIVCIFAGVFGWLNGNLRILAVGGQDFMGNTCGQEAAFPPHADHIRQTKHEWEELKYLWYPIDPDSVGNSLSDTMRFGVCVAECPAFAPDASARQMYDRRVKQYMWEWGLSNFEAGCRSSRACRNENFCAPSIDAGCVRAFDVLYPTTLLHHACVPDVYRNSSMHSVSPQVQDLMHQLSGDIAFHRDWWFSVTADCYAARNIILAGCFVTFVYGELYLLLTKWNPLYVAWGSVFLLLASCITTAMLLLDHADMLRTTDVEKYLMQKRYESQFSTFAYVLIVVGTVNAIMCLLLRKKVVIASQMMVESNKVLKESPGISAVAPFMWLLQVGIVSLAYFTLLFMGSIGFNEDVHDGRQYTNISPFALPYHLVPKSFTLFFLRTPFQVLMIIVVMWSMGFVNTIGYSFTSFISCMWYFSKPGSIKDPPRDGVWITFSCVLKHMGSCAVGAVILTLFESIRGYLEKIQTLLRNILERLPQSLFMFTCIIHYVLMLFDKGLKLVRRDAFVIQCIEGSDFMHAARRAGRLYEANKGQIKMIAEVSENVALFGRLGILSITLLTTTLLLLNTPMGDGIDNPVIIIIVITANSFFVSTLFAQITNATMDTFLMCYCYDMDVNDGSVRRPYFTHASLKEFIDQHASIKNDYRNIYAGNDFTVGNLRHQILDAKQRVEENLKDAEKITKATAKTVRGTAKTLAGEAGKTAKKTAEISRKAAEISIKAAEDAANKVETGAKTGASTISKSARQSVKSGILSKATGALGAEINKAQAAAGKTGPKRKPRPGMDSPSMRSRSSMHDPLRSFTQSSNTIPPMQRRASVTSHNT